MNKLQLISDCVLWDGDQIGFLTDDKTIEMHTSFEDFENGEIDVPKQKEILAFLPEIEKALRLMGFAIEREADTSDWSKYQ